jgi:hypothetical protein
MQRARMTVTLNVPDEFAAYLPSKDSDLISVLTAGLLRWKSRQLGELNQFRDVAELLTSLPSPEEVLALRPSVSMARRSEELLQKSRGRSLSPDEQTEWDEIMRAEHLVRMAKAQAAIKLKKT